MIKWFINLIKIFYLYLHKAGYRSAAIGGNYIDQIGYAEFCLNHGYYVEAYSFAAIASSQNIIGSVEIKNLAKNKLTTEDFEKALALIEELKPTMKYTKMG